MPPAASEAHAGSMHTHHSYAGSTYDVIMHRHQERIDSAERARIVRRVRRARLSARAPRH